MVVVLWQGGLLVLDGKLTAGSLVCFLLYTFTIAAAVGALASFFSSYQESVGAAERVFQLLESPRPSPIPTAPSRSPSRCAAASNSTRCPSGISNSPDAPWALRED